MTSDSTQLRSESGLLDEAMASDVAASVTLIAFNVAVYVAIRYAPEYLRLLGNGPVVIGLFGSVATLLAVVYPRFGTAIDRLGASARPIVGALASLGVVCWLVAPQVGSTDGYRPVVLVFVGLAFVSSWDAFGVDMTAASASILDRVRDRTPQVLRHARTPRYVALIAGLPLIVGLMAMISPALVAIQVVLGLAAALGLTAVVLLAVLDGFDDRQPSGSQPVPSEATDGKEPVVPGSESFRRTLDVLRSLPRTARQPLVGDVLVEFAVGMVSVFLVITVTSVLQVDVTLMGQRLHPDAFFAVCLFAEMAVALVSTGLLTRLASRVGRERVVAGTFAIAALFPIALVSAPTNATIVAGLFAVFGLYRAGLPIRRAFIGSVLPGDDTNDFGDYRTVRAALGVPSALVGGVLYAVSPVLAFGLATVIGMIGVRELLVGTTRIGASRTGSR